MESEILTEGFKKSLEQHNLIYGRLISDGDANTYSKILQARPYTNYTVEKVECRNHLLRNFCNKLVAVSTDTKYFLKFRKHITKKRILSTRKVVIEAIKKYKNSDNITGLHQDIVNAPDHAFGRHGKCKEYFCSITDKDESVDREMFSNSIWQRIKLITAHLAAHARSLILDVDSNAVERYHSIVAKFVGGKRINFSRRYQYQMRCNAAAVSFNTQKPLSILHKSIVGRSPHNEIKRNEEKRLKSRQLTQKYLRIKKRLFHAQDSRNYGEDCSKPDLDEDMMAESKKAFLQNLQKNNEEREKIMNETVLQSGSSEWLELRRNILTASNFGRVIKRRMDVSCQNMVKDILYKKSIDHVKSIKHGRDNEKLALEQLSQQEKVEIHPCGLYIDPDVPYLGASPDGIIKEDMVVEIKCPKTCYNIGVEKAVEEKKLKFYKKTKDGVLEVNKDHYWYFQAQGQLHVTRREKCMFGIWSGNKFPIKTEIIDRDDKFWSDKMEKKLKDFYIDCLLPELVDPRHTRKMPIRDPVYITEAIQVKKTKQAKSSAGKKRKMAPETEQHSRSAQVLLYIMLYIIYVIIFAYPLYFSQKYNSANPIGKYGCTFLFHLYFPCGSILLLIIPFFLSVQRI